MKAHCIMHVPYESPGIIEVYMINNGINISYTRIYEKVEFPDPEDVDFLIIMGGPMSVYEEDIYPWLKEEKIFISNVIDAGKKALGICLGSQFIAEVLGAKVYPNKIKEIGWFPIFKTDEGKTESLLNKFNDENMVFHWHGDTYDLPPGAIHLFRSEHCQNQAYIYENRVVGLQFHLETTPETLQGMLDAGKSEIVENICIQTVEEIADKIGYTSSTNILMYNLLDELLGLKGSI